METFSALLAICAGIHRSPVDSPHKGQWRGALMFSFICVWINGWVNNREAGDLRRYRAHYDVTVMNVTKHQRHAPASTSATRDKAIYIGSQKLITFNNYGAETGIFRENRSMPLWFMSWLVARSSEAMVFTVQENRVPLFRVEGFQLPAPAQCWKMAGDEHMFLYPLK